MGRGSWIAFVALIWLGAAASAFALNLDSLPVWNPDYLVQNVDVADAANGVPQGSSSVSGADDAASGKVEAHGYKTMQVTVGDGGTEVDQELRLSIQGMVGDSVYIDALLSDVDRKAGDQTTATLQEVDQIYFRAEARHWFVHLGDLTWRDESLGLSGIERSTLGAMAGIRGGYTEVRGAAGTDEVNRISRTFNGVSGQREGYAISGDGEYLAVVPGSEKVWVNGVELRRDKDYDVNYAGGLLNFKGRWAPGADDEIRIEYDAYEDDNIFNLYAAAGKYRHPNLYLDVAGFRLENDRHRLKKSVWTDEDYQTLKADRGGMLYHTPDSLEDELDSVALNRPERIDRVGTRLRTQFDNRFYADLEMAVSRRDSNTVSHHVGGPEGNAFRWYATTDSSARMLKFPVAFSVYGNYVEEEFGIGDYQGTDRDWNSYKLQDDWDLDSSAITSGDLRHDEFGMRIRLGSDWFAKTLWGYRQGENQEWNSSRVKVSLEHLSQNVASDVGIVRVASVQNGERERYQALGNAQYLQGFWRPFGNFDARYTKIDETAAGPLAGDVGKNSPDAVSRGAFAGNNGVAENEVFYGKSGAGFSLNANNWNASEGVETKLARRRGDTYGDDWNDSLKSVAWTQTAEYHHRYLDISHFLQYEHREVDSTDGENSWVGDLQGIFGDEDLGFSGNVSYKLGLTEEQTYTAIYKAVAPGTGDVRYDSLTGAFIEGVDNGDFVYEGMGRNDSIGAVRASNAAFSLEVDWNPGLLLGIHEGILRDITVGGSYSAEGEDTTGKKLYFPPASRHQLREISSGNVTWEGRISLDHPSGFSATYKPGALYDKKLSSISYFEEMLSHQLDLGYQITDAHFVGGMARLEDAELEALQNLDWNAEEFSARYRFSFAGGFHVEPGGRYRTGDGSDGGTYDFDARLWEGYLRFGYEKENVADGFVQFSAIEMDKGENAIPYQLMSGYGEGRTYRLESVISVDMNEYISFGLRYVLRFGNAEENIFQKLSTEARAVF